MNKYISLVFALIAFFSAQQVYIVLGGLVYSSVIAIYRLPLLLLHFLRPAALFREAIYSFTEVSNFTAGPLDRRVTRRKKRNKNGKKNQRKTIGFQTCNKNLRKISPNQTKNTRFNLQRMRALVQYIKISQINRVSRQTTIQFSKI